MMGLYLVGWGMVSWAQWPRLGFPPLHYVLCELGDIGERLVDASACLTHHGHRDRIRALPSELFAWARLPARHFMCTCVVKYTERKIDHLPF